MFNKNIIYLSIACTNMLLFSCVNSSSNEYSEGGKFYGRGGNNTELYGGNPFVYSNDGEVEILENFFKNFEELDYEGISSAISDSVWFRSLDGSVTFLTNIEIKNRLESRISHERKLWAILPNKIKNRPGGAAVTVSSYVKDSFKDGTVLELELMELFYFNEDLKIAGVEQWSRPVIKESE